MKKTPILFSALAAILFATGGLHAQQFAVPEEEGQERQQADELEEIHREYQQINEKLNQIQQEAFQVDRVQEALHNYEKVLSEAMIEIDPTVEEKIARQEELIEELRNAANPADEDFQRQMGEFREIQQELSPVEHRASQEPEVTEVRDEYHEALLSEMRSIDSDVDELFEQRNTLAAQLQAIQQQMFQQE